MASNKGTAALGDQALRQGRAHADALRIKADALRAIADGAPKKAVQDRLRNLVLQEQLRNAEDPKIAQEEGRTNSFADLVPKPEVQFIDPSDPESLRLRPSSRMGPAVTEPAWQRQSRVPIATDPLLQFDGYQGQPDGSLVPVEQPSDGGLLGDWVTRSRRITQVDGRPVVSVNSPAEAKAAWAKLAKGAGLRFPDDQIRWKDPAVAFDDLVPKADSATLNILAGARNAPRMKVIPRDHFGEPVWTGIPEPVRRRLQMKRVRGKYFPASEEVYVMPGETPAEERLTAYHEVAGHYGLQGAMGDDYAAIMSRAMQNPTVKVLTDAMRGRSPTYRALDDWTAAEEALSELAAATRTGDYARIEDLGVRVPVAARPGVEGMLNRVVQLTKRKLADLTGEEPDAYDDAQVYGLLENAWRYVQRPRPKTPAEKEADLQAAAAAAMDAGVTAASRQGQ